jgi:hypothetical protein
MSRGSGTCSSGSRHPPSPNPSTVGSRRARSAGCRSCRGPAGPPAANRAGFAYSVPEGWSNPEDNQDGYVLVRRDAPDGAGIFVFSDVLAHAQGIDPVTKQCRIEPARGIGSSASAIHDWIRSLPGLRIANDHEGVSIGNVTGYSVDVSVDPTWSQTCGWPDEKPGVPMFVNAQTTPDEGLDWGINGEGHMRLFILSLAPDRTLLVDIEAQDKATWDALLNEAAQIVHTFEFRH